MPNPDNDNIKALYNELKNTYEVGSEQEFRDYLGNADNREALRKELEADYDVGDSASFAQYLGFGATTTPQDTTPAPQPTAQQTTTQPKAPVKTVEQRSKEKLLDLAEKKFGTRDENELMQMAQEQFGTTDPKEIQQIAKDYVQGGGMKPVQKKQDSQNQPLPPEKFAQEMAMQTALQQRMQGFTQRLDNIRKGNKPFSDHSEQVFNPQTGKTEKVYYTQQGDVVGTPLEQWEANHVELRYQQAIDKAMEGLDGTAAEQAWQQALARIERDKKENEKKYEERMGKLTLFGQAMGTSAHMNTGQTGTLTASDAYATELGVSNRAAEYYNKDLERMSEDAWNNLGKEKQESIINDIYNTLKKYGVKVPNNYITGSTKQTYPIDGGGSMQLDEDARLRIYAEEIARSKSDQMMFDLAVKKNAPQSVKEYFFGKVMAANSFFKMIDFAARQQAGTRGDMEARELAEGQFEEKGGVGVTLAKYGGGVVGMVTDPWTIATAYVGGLAGKGVTWLGGKFIMSQSGQLLERFVGEKVVSAAGRMITGAVAGSATFGSYESGQELFDQMRWGGTRDIDPETGRYVYGDYDFGKVLDQTLHGFGMGAATGTFGTILGRVGNVATQSVGSTVGKIGVRTATVGAGIVGEGMIFSVPEWVSGEGDPFDVWEENLAMMLSFKIHGGIKSARQRIAQLRRDPNTRAGFETRLRKALDGTRPELALTANEKFEMKALGYEDLIKRVEGRGGLSSSEIPYDRIEQFVGDKNVSEAARAKMYYYLTGRQLPMSTIYGFKLDEQTGENGNVLGYVVRSIGADGNVITTRTFKNKESADAEVSRITRQAELNSIAQGERAYDGLNASKRMFEACEKVAEEKGIDAHMLYNMMKTDASKLSPMESELAKQVVDTYNAAANGITDYAPYTSAALRSSMSAEKYENGTNKKGEKQYASVDLEKAIAKEPNRRSEAEKKAVEEYNSRLWESVREVTGREDFDVNTDPYAMPVMSKSEQRGYTADAQERKDILLELAMNENPTEEQKEAWKGVERRIKDEEDFLAALKRDLLAKTTHRADQTVKEVNIIDEDDPNKDKTVYLVDGNVTMLQGGKDVDTENSDQMVTIYDPNTGEKKAISSGEIRGFVSVMSADDVDAQIQFIHDYNIQRAKAEARGVITVNIGDELPMGDGTVGIVAAISEDGEEITVAGADENGNPRQEVLTRSELQEASDQAAVKDYLQRHQHEMDDDLKQMIDEVSAEEQQPVAEEQPTETTEEQTPVAETETPQEGEQGEGNGWVSGIPAEYTPGMEIEFTDDDGYVRRGIIQQKTKSENGKIVPDPEGRLYEIYDPVEGELVHIHENNIDGRVKSYRDKTVEPAEPTAETPVETPQTPVKAETESEAPVTPTEPQTSLTMPMREVRGKQIPAYEQATAEQTYDYVYNQAGLDEQDADKFVQNKLTEANEALTKAQKGEPQIGTDIDNYKAQHAKWEQDLQAAQRNKDMWEQVKAMRGVEDVQTPETPVEPTTPTETEPVAETETTPTEETAPVAEEKTPAQQQYEAVLQKYGDKAGHKIDVTVADKNNTVADKKKNLEKKQKAFDDAPIGKEDNAEKALVKAQAEYDAAVADKELWDGVKAEHDKARNAALKAQQERERAAIEASEEREKQRQAEELAKRQEQEERGANAVHPAIREKWESAEKVDGFENEIALANGETIKGHYALVESGAATPSHDPNNEFARYEGFPIDENGQTVNDRDYERDKNAQLITRQMANNYDSRALNDVPVVSNDGVVLSGNGRTMAGELAAQQNTDGAYIEHLKKYPQRFGFTAEQVSAMKHPRVVFVTDGNLPYTTETFAKFNAEEKKSQNRTEQAVKLGKTVDDATFGRIINTINRFDTISEFYNDPKAAPQALAELHKAGVINDMQLAEMMDGDKISARGREILENMLIGKAFESNPDAVRQIAEFPSMRERVITALTEISNNIHLGEDYSLENELAEAINLTYQARKSGIKKGEKVNGFARQQNLFPFDTGDTVADYTNIIILSLGDRLNDDKVSALKKALSLYNQKAENSAAGQYDMFSGVIKSKEEIYKDVEELLNHGTKQEQQSALESANEQRKRNALQEREGETGVQKNGVADGVDAGTEPAGRGTEPAERPVAQTEGGESTAEWDNHVNQTLDAYDKAYAELEKTDGERLRNELSAISDERLLNTYINNLAISDVFGKGREAFREYIGTADRYKPEKLDEVKQGNLEAVPEVARQSFVMDLLKAELDRRGIEYKDKYTTEEKNNAFHWLRDNVPGFEDREKRAELEKRLAEERKQRILSEGTSFDKVFDLIPVSEDMTVEDIDTNVQRLVSGLKQNEGNKELDSYYGFAYNNDFKKNAGNQTYEYIYSLGDVIPDETLKAWADKHGFKTKEDIIDYGKKLYTETATQPTSETTEQASDKQIAIENDGNGNITNSDEVKQEIPSLTTAEATENPVGTAAKVAKQTKLNIESSAEQPIEDFGEHIGGARKETATSGFKRGDADGRPAWRKKYKFVNTNEELERIIGMSPSARTFGASASTIISKLVDATLLDHKSFEKQFDPTKPFYAYYAVEKKSPWGVSVKYYPVVDENRKLIPFTSEEEAERVIPVFEAQDQGYRIKESRTDGKFVIYRRASNGKDVEYDEFGSKEEAIAYLTSVEGATSLLNRKRENFELPGLDKVSRENMPDYRKGRNITTDDFMQTFGFRGGEFGNWLNNDERQSALNTAYDALMDLATTLGISPKALSLGGQLGIAFGARGVRSAKAHYEPVKAVINLTKLNGAGSLAHEWAHALDNYFALIDARIDRSTAKEGVLDKFITDELSWKHGARDEVRDAFSAIARALSKKETEREIAIDKEQADYDKTASQIDLAAKHYREDLERGVQKRRYNRKEKKYEYVQVKLTPEQLAEYDRLVEELKTDDTFHWWGPEYGNVATKLLDLVKEIKPGKHGGYETLHNLWYYKNKLMMQKKRLDQAKENAKEIVTIKSSLLENSEWFDKGRAGSYFSKPIEMFARAFESYVQRKMAEKGQQSTYLTYDKGTQYKAMWGHNPYPEGEEAEQLDKLFDNFFGVVQEREENGKTYLYQKAPDSRVEAPTEVQKALTQGVVDVIGDMGMPISTDIEEGYDALDKYEERVKKQKAEGKVFYSNAEKAVEGIKQEKATAEQWLKMIEKNGGLKAGEDKWTGLSEWLKEKGNAPLTKQEVMDYIRENEIQVEEENYGDIEQSKQWKDLQDRFIELYNESTKFGTVDKADEAFEKLAAENNGGDDFSLAFYHDEYMDENGKLHVELRISDDNAAAYFLGETNPINDTRLQYTTDGLKNKREIVLTVPTIEPWNESDEIHFGEAGEGRAVAWVRFGETTGKDGKRVLVIDEIQSKRHQEGRERGYKKNTKDNNLIFSKSASGDYWLISKKDDANFFDRTVALTNETADEANLRYNSNVGIPDAPFDKNWHELAMKRMLRYAAENGYDKVAWTKGEQQAERYDIGKVVNDVDIEPHENENGDIIKGSYDVIARDVNGRSKIDAASGTFTNEEILRIYGKELGGRLIAGADKYPNGFNMRGDDLRIGGEGMKGFYDNMLPRFMDKYGKKWGVKTSEVELPELEEAGRKMWSVDVTPEMRNSVMEGQPMFFRTKDGEVYGFVVDGKIYIDPRIAKPDTPIHEYGHLWAQALRQAEPRAWEQLKSEMFKEKDIADFVRNKYPELETEDEIAEEIFTHYGGKRGRERLEAEMKAEMDKADGVFEKAQVASVFQKIKELLAKFWNMARDMFAGRMKDSAIAKLKGEDFADMMMNDLLRGFDPRKYGVREDGEMSFQKAEKDKLDKASQFINDVLKAGTKQKNVKVDLPEVVNRKAERELGHPIKSHTINANEIRHANNQHGINGKALTANSIPLRKEDFALMPYIMAAPSRIKKGSTAANGTESVRYEKDLENGNVVVVEREGRLDIEEMENITMWAEKKSATNVTVAPRASHSTSETIVISEADIAKIKHDAERAIELDAKIQQKNESTKNNLQSSENKTDTNTDTTPLYRTSEELDEENAHVSTPEAKRETVQKFAEKLNTPVNIIENVDDITSDNPAELEKMKRSQGWYDPVTHTVTVVLPNNRNTEEAAATVFHETAAHMGLREMIGEERYDTFLDEVYNHLRGDLKRIVDENTTRAFLGDPTKAHDQHRRTQVDELIARIGEKQPEDITEEEMTLWERIKEIVRKAIDKFLGSLKLPSWVTLGDNELRYMVWRSRQRMERGRESFVDMAMDAAKREELGLSNEKSFSDKSDDILNDNTMDRQERATALALDMAEKNKEDAIARSAAMKAIGRNIASLRKAMSLQKEFDKSTVKRVTDFANLLIRHGYFSDMGKSEVMRLLSAVKNATAHTDITRDVDKIMGLAVDNQLRRAKEALDNVKKIRGSKVDARGVEVQGSLDVAGQQILKTFKEYIKSDEDAIDNAIAEATELMTGDNQVLADEAANRLAGLQCAKQYNETIKKSIEEEKELRQDLHTAEHDAVRNKGYEAALKEAIRQNKVERIQAYYDLLGSLSGTMRTSMENVVERKKAEKERIKEIHHNANSDMQGIPANEHYQPKFKDKVADNGVVHFMMSPLITFEQMLRLFGKKSVNGEGYLYNRFMRGWVNAREKEITGIRSKYAQLDAKAKEVFGVDTWADMMAKVAKGKKTNVRFKEDGVMQNHELQQGHLMYIYMVDKMLDGRMKLRKMGIDDFAIERITEALDPRLREVADWLQDEFLVDSRNEYNETHKRVFGASMAAIENYFPLLINKKEREDKEEELDQHDWGQGITTVTGAVKRRTRNTKGLDLLKADALHIILNHIAEMEHWNAFAEFNRDLNTLRTYKRFRNQMETMATVYGSGETLWKTFNDACRIATGSYRPSDAIADKAGVNIAKLVNASKVTLRMFTAWKQFASFIAYMPMARIDDLADAQIHWARSWKWCMENLPIFNERWNSRISGDPRLLKTDADWKSLRNNYVQMLAKIGMTPNAFIDALTVSAGAYAVYKTNLRRYLSYGYSQEVAEKKARQDAEIVPNLTQQSSEGAFLSPIQVDRTWYSVMYTVFRNASMSYFRQLHDAVRNLRRTIFKKGYRKDSIEFTLKKMMREGLSEGQASSAANREYNRQIKNDILRVVTFGALVQIFWNLISKSPQLIWDLLTGDDDDRDKVLKDEMAHSAFGWAEGLPGGNLISLGGQMWLMNDRNQRYSSQLLQRMPIDQDEENIIKEFLQSETGALLFDMLALIGQSRLGLNPQTITDVVVAAIDASNGDFGLAREAMFFAMRTLQIPQSQIDKMYFDEIDLTGKEAGGMDFEKLVERYAKYKLNRETLGMYTDKQLESKKKYGTKLLKEAVSHLPEAEQDSVLQRNYDNGGYETREMVSKMEAKRQGTKYTKPKTPQAVAYENMRNYVDMAEDTALKMAIKDAKSDGAANEKRYKNLNYYQNKIDKEKDKLANPMSDEEKQKIMEQIRKWRNECFEKVGVVKHVVNSQHKEE